MLQTGFVKSQSGYGTVTPRYKSVTNLLRRCPCICDFSGLSLKQKIKRSQFE